MPRFRPGTKIAFEPGSATVAADSRDTVNQIADILRECGPIRLEIQGHTDSQGREEMNQQLSQSTGAIHPERAARTPYPDRQLYRRGIR